MSAENHKVVEVTDVQNCSHCGQDHKKVEVLRVIDDIWVSGHPPPEWYFWCPEKGRPVFVDREIIE